MMLYLGLLLGISNVAGQRCDFSAVEATEVCIDTWSNLREVLHPMQPTIGMAWMRRKLRHDMSSAEDAQEYLDAKTIPVILGPGRMPYVVDGHHTLSALDKSNFPGTNVTVTVICDWSWISNEQSFFDEAAHYNFLAPGATLPLPRYFANMTDNPVRSIVGYSRKIKHHNVPSLEKCPKHDKHCHRCFDRVCAPDGGTTPFFEFIWGVFVKAGINETSLWDDAADQGIFVNSYNSLPLGSNASFGHDDEEKWLDAAALLLPLCRGQSAGFFRLPDDLGPPLARSALPGFVFGVGTVIEPEDPDCIAPKCPAACAPATEVAAARDIEDMLLKEVACADDKDCAGLGWCSTNNRKCHGWKEWGSYCNAVQKCGRNLECMGGKCQ